MNTHFDRFKQAIDSGKRTEAAAALKPFIESFSSLEEKTTWSKWYLENEALGHKIRHEIYEHVVFPVLLDGYRRSDPWSLLWLARTIQNLYQSKQLWEKIEMKTDYALLKELLVLSPQNEQVESELLSKQLEWFRYSAHEWPAGILYGQDGATANQCIEILEEVCLARKINKDALNEVFLSEFESKVREYRQRLTKPSSGRASPAAEG